MKTVKVDDSGDRIINNGLFVYLFNLDAVIQTCEQVMKQQLGELQYNLTKGIEYFNNVFNGEPNFQLFEFQARQQLLNVEGVLSIDSFSYEHINNVLSYTTTIKTIYGNGEING